jgi:phospholipase C
VELIKHVFVLMLENRSFDHMFGASRFAGTDAATQTPTRLNSLPAGASNSWNGKVFPAKPPAVDPMIRDPRHEFEDVLEQLCGDSAKYPPGGPYPAINNSGFVSNFARNDQPHSDPADVMKYFEPSHLPVMYTLAQEFAVCDSWFCSMPGPTWPNRFFALGASSAGLDHSPSTEDTLKWEPISGFKFQNGSIFESSGGFFPFKHKLKWRIYSGSIILTMAHALAGIHLQDIIRYKKFAGDVSDPNYSADFTWIEPNYGNVAGGFVGGASQHPLDGVAGGEALIKATYEAIRNSPLWDSSMLIITWDEHGGFFDHVKPGPAVNPGDRPQFAGANWSGFAFDQYGPRIPALVISPLVPQGTIDHRIYDHSSIPATVERLFNVGHLTERDQMALDLRSLASLTTPRSDTPETIELPPEAEELYSQVVLDSLEVENPPAEPAGRDNEPVESVPSLPSYVFSACRTDYELFPEAAVDADRAAWINSRVRAIRTCGDAREYINEVRRKALAAGVGGEWAGS